MKIMKTSLIVAITVIFSPLVLAVSASSATAPNAGLPDSNIIRMTADKQSYSLERKRYLLNGKVTVNYKDINITGPRAEMVMNEEGKPEVAKFFERPLFKQFKAGKGEDQVRGDIINVYLGDDRFGAMGNVEAHINSVAADPFLIRSDIQEFDNKNKVMSASGNVLVDYQGSKASSQLANVRMKDDGNAERVIFSGGARLKKENTDISGSKITVMVDSGNLIAENTVKTFVDLKNQQSQQSERVVITSDYQQFDKASDTMIASGNVKILYGDYVAVGPKATFKLKNNDLDRIFLTGRATITETGRVITADKITITTNPRNFDAVGNVKVNFKAAGSGAAASSNKPASGAAAKPAAPSAKPSTPSAVGGKHRPQDDPSDY